MRYPRPHVTGHSDHSDHAVVAQDTSPTQSVSHVDFSTRVTAQFDARAFGVET